MRNEFYTRDGLLARTGVQFGDTIKVMVVEVPEAWVRANLTVNVEDRVKEIFANYTGTQVNGLKVDRVATTARDTFDGYYYKVQVCPS